MPRSEYKMDSGDLNVNYHLKHDSVKDYIVVLYSLHRNTSANAPCVSSLLSHRF